MELNKLTLPAEEELSFSGRRSGSSSWIGWFLLALAALIALVIALTPAPYVISQPGPAYDTLGMVEINGKAKPLISVTDAKTYPTDGALYLLTVSQRGTPTHQPSWIEVVSAWFDQTKTVHPIEEMYPNQIDFEYVQQQNALQMENSKHQAVAAALSYLGYEFDSKYVVNSFLADSLAAAVLQQGDQIVSVNGIQIATVEQLRGLLAENGDEKPADIVVLRAGSEVSYEITPSTVEGHVVLGILLEAVFDFPVAIDIQLEKVGGSSAGMMFALGIIDKMTENSLTGGRIIAGTGTIEADGTVGVIGGVPQKVAAAAANDAEWMLLQQDNCGELPDQLPEGIQVVPIKTLSDAVDVVTQIANGVDRAKLPSCPVR